MAAEQVLKLLDSYWFETTIFSNKTPSKFHQKVDQNKVVEVLPIDTQLLLVPTLEIRSYSDQNIGSTPNIFSDSPSPNSVLSIQKLRTITSETEIREFSMVSNRNHDKEDINNTKKKLSNSYRRKRRRLLRKEKGSMSLSELEFKELKGFMDLGFVFSKEDKDSKLVSLIPGLQRLGRQEEEEDAEEEHKIDESVICDKPYLSEAWGVLEEMEVKIPWRVPVQGNDIDMKHSLRFWAHTVASSIVR
ncbi:hypothetical protein Lalb_Chr19g0134831 [Lupinus albus]|uniref:DUF1685 family protein n=1 Tax=Lupinus albus TaxID=3870 RepID=A0A6A4NV83_LUPAL|nr:hypothetical protein Lalb_Chr19g0134831 [Lupinus albus]